MAKAAVEIPGLKDWVRELRAIDDKLPKAVRAAGKGIAAEVAKAAQSKASAMGGIWAKAAGDIRPYATQTSTSVGFPSGGIAGAAFWGTLKRTGWFAAGKYRSYPAQNPKWVGNSWEPGVAGQGPYAINDALAQELPRILDLYGNAVEEATGQAFPN